MGFKLNDPTIRPLVVQALVARVKRVRREKNTWACLRGDDEPATEADAQVSRLGVDAPPLTHDD